MNRVSKIILILSLLSFLSLTLIVVICIKSRYREKYINKNLIVYSYGTDRSKCQSLIKSAKKNGINLQLYGLNRKWNGFQDKLTNFYNFLQKIDDNKIVSFVDSYDVTIVDNADNIIKKFLSFKKPIVISAEKGCWPDKNIKRLYPKSKTPFKYVNSGTYIGYAGAIKKMLSEFKKNNYNCSNILNKKFNVSDDQRCLTTYYLKNQDIVVLDYTQKIFSCLYATDPSNFDVISQNKVINKVTNTQTSMLHGNSGDGMVYINIINKILKY